MASHAVAFDPRPNFGFHCFGTTVNLPKTGRFIFPASGGRELLSQCSRPAPSEIAGFWQPTAQDIDELETALSKYLEQREKDKKQTPPKANYHRQYVGFVRRLNSEHPNERFIYGNFYPERDGSQLDESKTAIQVCDGGPVFWGIVYRPSTKTFEDLDFNGFG
jgi:hypothetical protein